MSGGYPREFRIGIEKWRGGEGVTVMTRVSEFGMEVQRERERRRSEKWQQIGVDRRGGDGDRGEVRRSKSGMAENGGDKSGVDQVRGWRRRREVRGGEGGGGAAIGRRRRPVAAAAAAAAGRLHDDNT